MKAYEFPCKVTSEGRLELPDALMKLLPANQVVQVIILLRLSQNCLLYKFNGTNRLRFFQ
jgi:hypothetical protein